MIVTQVQTETGEFVVARHLKVQGKHPRARRGLYQEIVQRIENLLPHNPIEYEVHGVAFTEPGADKLRVSTEPQVVNAPECPVVRLATVTIGDKQNMVTIFTRPLGPYERDVRKAHRVFLVALDTGRWMKFLSWSGDNTDA